MPHRVRTRVLRRARWPLWQLLLPGRGGGRPPRQAGPDLPGGTLQSRRARRPLQAGLARLSREARLHARLTGSRRDPRLQARLSLRTRLLRTSVLPLQAGTGGRILPALNLPLGDDPASEILRRVDLTHKALIAQRLLRRDHERHRGEAPAAHGRPDCKTAGALRQKTEPRPGAVVDLDPSHFAVRVRIEFYRDVVGATGCRTFRH